MGYRSLYVQSVVTDYFPITTSIMNIVQNLIHSLIRLSDEVLFNELMAGREAFRYDIVRYNHTEIIPNKLLCPN